MCLASTAEHINFKLMLALADMSSHKGQPLRAEGIIPSHLPVTWKSILPLRKCLVNPASIHLAFPRPNSVFSPCLGMRSCHPNERETHTLRRMDLITSRTVSNCRRTSVSSGRKTRSNILTSVSVWI
jgi:hypothetical protein